MEKLSEATAAVYAVLIRDYYLWVGILAIVLVFALYVYLKPATLEFFTGSQKAAKKEDAEPRQESEPEPKNEAQS